MHIIDTTFPFSIYDVAAITFFVSTIVVRLRRSSYNDQTGYILVIVSAVSLLIAIIFIVAAIVIAARNYSTGNILHDTSIVNQAVGNFVEALIIAIISVGVLLRPTYKMVKKSIEAHRYRRRY